MLNFPNRRLVSQDDAAIVEGARVPRSTFTGAWTRKMAFDAGFLVPFVVDEILPGDHMRYSATAYVRMSTPLFPLMDNQRIDTFWFFVPNRLVWTNWARFMGEQDSPGSSIAFSVPQVDLTRQAIGSIWDHMGLPALLGQYAGAADATPINILPFRMYNLIFNTWFRDENIINGLVQRTGDTGDLIADFQLRRRAKSHDYFTSALPWPQKFTAPTVPLGGLAPVLGLGHLDGIATTGPAGGMRETGGGTAVYDFYQSVWTTDKVLMKMTAAADGYPMVFADLSAVAGVTINTLRQAWLVQSLLERDARGGTRYVELIRSHFGVTNPDFRLQRPEYIGGGQTPLQLTPIAQTAPTAGAPVGVLGAAGTAAGSHQASYAATEHGFIIGLINVRTELSYQQGLHKMWSRVTRYDYYWPSLAGLGEQAILRKELYSVGILAGDNTVFGYQERWHEYRTRQSEVTGIFRSFATGTLDAWHFSQRFTAAPTLSEAFIDETPPMDRVLAAGSLAIGQQYLADILINRTATRAIPTYGTPVNLGRF